jgi:hypothetical protein
MDKTEARTVLKLSLQPMNWLAVRNLAKAVAALGDEAAAEMEKLAEWKHERAVQRGDAYIPRK